MAYNCELETQIIAPSVQVIRPLRRSATTIRGRSWGTGLARTRQRLSWRRVEVPQDRRHQRGDRCAQVPTVRDDKPICTLSTTVANSAGGICLSGMATTYTVPLE
jgi:hypothetical protein